MHIPQTRYVTVSIYIIVIFFSASYILAITDWSSAIHLLTLEKCYGKFVSIKNSLAFAHFIFQEQAERNILAMGGKTEHISDTWTA